MKKNDLISLIEHGVIDSSSDSNTLNLKDEIQTTIKNNDYPLINLSAGIRFNF
jgi:hypothetical protein